MSVEAIPHCVYGFSVSVDEFLSMIDIAEYDSLEDWIDDYNRYEWVFFDDWDNYVYFGLPIHGNIDAKYVFQDWMLFKVNTILTHVNLNYLPEDEREEGPYFHVFNIWD